MAVAGRYREYLVKAEEAELQAAKAADALIKSSWLRVAAGYRDLAKMIQTGRPQN